MEFPKVFEECPFCECRERVVEAVVNELKKDGKIGPERIPCSFQKVLPIVDPTIGTIFFTILQIFYDMCAKCGYEYPHTIIKEKVTQEQLQAILQGQMVISKQ
jgi:hypothetical protein